MNASHKIRDRFVQQEPEADSDSDLEYPLTPPISRPVSPENAMTPEELGVLTVNLLQGTEVRPSRRKSRLTRRPEGQGESIRIRSHACIHIHTIRIEKRGRPLSIWEVEGSSFRDSGVIQAGHCRRRTVSRSHAHQEHDDKRPRTRI